jgi:hypothetical protein
VKALRLVLVAVLILASIGAVAGVHHPTYSSVPEIPCTNEAMLNSEQAPGDTITTISEFGCQGGWAYL